MVGDVRRRVVERKIRRDPGRVDRRDVQVVRERVAGLRVVRQRDAVGDLLLHGFHQPLHPIHLRQRALDDLHRSAKHVRALEPARLQPGVVDLHNRIRGDTRTGPPARCRQLCPRLENSLPVGKSMDEVAMKCSTLLLTGTTKSVLRKATPAGV